MPSVEILAVGTELLLGQLLDSNTKHIAGTLADAGLDVYATHAVGDNLERISAAIRAALQRADGVVTSGGLGPTIDDLTKEAVCDALGLDTEFDQKAYRNIEEIFARSGREYIENNRKQAQVPRGSLFCTTKTVRRPDLSRLELTASSSLPCPACRMKCGRCFVTVLFRGFAIVLRCERRFTRGSSIR